MYENLTEHLEGKQFKFPRGLVHLGPLFVNRKPGNYGSSSMSDLELSTAPDSK